MKRHFRSETRPYNKNNALLQPRYSKTSEFVINYIITSNLLIRFVHNRTMLRRNEVAVDSVFHLCSVDSQPKSRDKEWYTERLFANRYTGANRRAVSRCCDVGLHKANINVKQTDTAMLTIQILFIN